jgi:sodium/bile acid cotransporter 7
MARFLARRWFLLVLLGGVTLGLASPDIFLPWTAALEPRVIVGAALFLMAWTLPSRRLAQELGRPAAALWAGLLSYGLLPGAAWLLGNLVPLADYRVGILIMASVPCTLASAVLWTRLSGGNEATALFVVLLTTATSWLVTTAWLAFLTSISVVMGEMILALLLTLVAPVALGQVSRAIPFMARAATRGRIGINAAAQLLVLAIILKAAAEVGARLRLGSSSLETGPLAAMGLLCFGLHLGVLATGYLTGSWLGFDRPTRIAVAFACSQKTLPVALVLYKDYYQDRYPLALVPLLLYHVGQLVLDTFIADHWMRNISGSRHKWHTESA